MARQYNASKGDYKDTDNVDLQAWKYRQGIRSSSAGQRHTPKPRKGTRAFKKQRAIREQLRNPH